MDKGVATRQRIIETAASLMNRRGWLSTPVSDVLTATELRKGGLYHHFDGIDSVARHAFQFAADKLVARVVARLGDEGSAQLRLMALLDAFDFSGQRQPPFTFGCPLLNAATEVDDQSEVFRRLVLAAFNRLIDAIEAVIAGGVRSRELRSDIAPRRAARFLLATFEGGVMLSGVARDPSWFSDLRDDLRDVIQSWSAPGVAA